MLIVPEPDGPEIWQESPGLSDGPAVDVLTEDGEGLEGSGVTVDGEVGEVTELGGVAELAEVGAVPPACASLNKSTSGTT